MKMGTGYASLKIKEHQIYFSLLELTSNQHQINVSFKKLHSNMTTLAFMLRKRSHCFLETAAASTYFFCVSNYHPIRTKLQYNQHFFISFLCMKIGTGYASFHIKVALLLFFGFCRSFNFFGDSYQHQIYTKFWYKLKDGTLIQIGWLYIRYFFMMIL